MVPNFSDPITCSLSDRRGRACVVCHCGAGRFGTLKYNRFRWRSIGMFNRLPKAIRMLSSCSVGGFKSKLDSYIRNIVDLPCRPGFNNSLGGGVLLIWRSLLGLLGGQLDAAKQSKAKVSKSKSCRMQH